MFIWNSTNEQQAEVCPVYNSCCFMKFSAFLFHMLLHSEFSYAPAPKLADIMTTVPLFFFSFITTIKIFLPKHHQKHVLIFAALYHLTILYKRRPFGCTWLPRYFVWLEMLITLKWFCNSAVASLIKCYLLTSVKLCMHYT